MGFHEDEEEVVASSYSHYARASRATYNIYRIERRRAVYLHAVLERVMGQGARK